ncbi:acyltransferase family protein [Sodalis sp. RH21]|uniref:acyltransferase family protein n=1 Tax=unclassified Sodalis (in: enterobacteria) TaxID=2636512 RepID=UPI0039B4EE41
MLGILRFFLASCVISFHLSAKIPNIGQLSVNFFYVISGYLITLILNDIYKFRLKKFSLNRFLRLYPAYYSFTFLSLVLAIIPISGVTSSVFHSSWSGSQQPFDILGNIFIFPWAFLSDQSVLAIPNLLYSEEPRLRLIPSTWSIAVEIVCYFILFIFTGRNIYTAIISFFLAALFHIYLNSSALNAGYIYYPFMSAMLPFSVGAIGCFLSKRIEKKYSLSFSMNKQFLSLAAIIFLFLFNWWLSLGSADFYRSLYFYTNNVIALFSIMILHNSKPSDYFKKVCKILGDLSYPMFLIHYIAGYIGWHIIGMPNYLRGWDIFIMGYIISVLISIACLIFIDQPIQKIRNKIRHQE